MTKRTPEQRAAAAEAKRNAPIGITEKQGRIDMQALPFAPPPPRERKPLGTRNGLNTYSRLGVNMERQAAKRMDTHGTHSDWVRTLPCCVCMPELYHGPTLKPFMYNPHNRGHFISDPHHVSTQGSGGKRDKCVPLCHPHHMQIDSTGWGHATFEHTYSADLYRIAALLWELSPERGTR